MGCNVIGQWESHAESKWKHPEFQSAAWPTRPGLIRGKGRRKASGTTLVVTILAKRPCCFECHSIWVPLISCFQKRLLRQTIHGNDRKTTAPRHLLLLEGQGVFFCSSCEQPKARPQFVGERRGSLLTKNGKHEAFPTGCFPLHQGKHLFIIPISLFDRSEFLAIDKEGCGTLKTSAFLGLLHLFFCRPLIVLQCFELSALSTSKRDLLAQVWSVKYTASLKMQPFTCSTRKSHFGSSSLKIATFQYKCSTQSTKHTLAAPA